MQILSRMSAEIENKEGNVRINTTLRSVRVTTAAMEKQ
jgi:L-lactate utilization protein LutB